MENDSNKNKTNYYGASKTSKAKKRSLGIRDRKILYEDRAKGKCQHCGGKILFSEIHVGHKTAYSKGGSTSFRNVLALCYGCNNKQGTDSYTAYCRKTGKSKVASRTTIKKKQVKKKTKSTGAINWITGQPLKL